MRIGVLAVKCKETTYLGTHRMTCRFWNEICGRKDIFALERCWMRGHRNNRWLFAAMGVAVQLHQARALKTHRSTWKIKQEVLDSALAN
jgi:hypothetical protein